MRRFLLDTHVWIWMNLEPQKLGAEALKILSSPEKSGELFLSAISIWEFSKLLEKKRLQITCHPEKWIWEALDIPGLQLAPLTPSIAYNSTCLPGPFHDDPADQIIVATAREEDAVIITADKRIQDYRHVRCIW